MLAIMSNSVFRVESDDLDGFYRVVAVPPGLTVIWLAYIGPREGVGQLAMHARPRPPVASLITVAACALHDLEINGQLAKISLQSKGKLLMPQDSLSDEEIAILQRRRRIMAPFLNHQVLTEALSRTGSLGELVRNAVNLHQCSRSTVYRLWAVLCLHGFEGSSLNPRFERCGAPGVLRPVEGERKKPGPPVLRERLGDCVQQPQIGVTEADRNRVIQHYRIHVKAAGSAKHLYDRIIESAYVNMYIETDKGRKPVFPEQGTFPNRRQVRHILDSGVARIERVLRRTTAGHFQRNLRGLHGKSHDGIMGPGHMYAIDSTVGDIHLRSSVNRAWLIGRPIVYMVVDVWSTAIVGFYVCLSGPAWSTAKVALYSTFCDQSHLAELWGYQSVMALTPPPAIPYMIESDRGEYLSRGARETGEALGVNMVFNPAYRPDLKGLVEVLNRISKDEQFNFLPGAIDARRRELELKINAKESALTIREYVQFLHGTFTHYNLFADRSHRLTTEMIAAGVQPSPAGLWRFGHEVGVGYRKEIGESKLITNLLPAKKAIVRRDGVFLEQLQYEASVASEQMWTTQARNFGVLEKTVHHFPGSTSRFWWPDPTGIVHEFALRANARASPDISLDEWRDALMYDRKKRDDREYARLTAAIENMRSTDALTTRAIELTKAADAAYEGPRPSSREARSLEPSLFATSTTPATDAVQSNVNAEKNEAYEALMDDVFASMNREGGE